MRYSYNPLKKECKSLTGAVPRSGKVTLRVFKDKQGGEADFSADVCMLVLHEDGKECRELPMRRTRYGFCISLRFHRTGLYFYHFRLGGRSLGCGKFREGVLTDHPQDWQITVYSSEYSTPDWIKGGVMYQIFPDRFYKSGEYPVPPHKILRRDWGGTPSFRPNEFGKVLNNDFFGGNFNGIREKLDYLRSLHVSAIYFNPVFEAYSNHRYDTGDYRKLDGLLGTEADFDALLSAAKERGIRVILDGVFNHTGDDSRYFNKYGRYKEELGAHQSPDSPYFSWYRFRDFPDSYESWWGIDTLPAVNEANPAYREFILGENGVVRSWMRHGISGWRLDVADELPDFFLEELRGAVKTEDPSAVVIGEVWEDASNKIAYDERRHYLQGKELDSVMNYPLKDAILNFVLSGNTTQLRETVASLVDNYPKQTLDCLMNILGTHDTPRILTVLSGKHCSDKEEMSRSRLTEQEREEATKKLFMAATLQFTLPGVPCIYYGDEVGMEGFQDPFCRGCFEWERTGCDIEAFYRKLGKLRSETLSELFKDGEYDEVYADANFYMFRRKKGEREAYVFANNSHGEYNIRLDGTYYEHLSGKTYQDRVRIDGFSYGILTKAETYV